MDKTDKKALLWHILITTGFGAGFSPFAPGTAGAIVAVLIWLAAYAILPFQAVSAVTFLLIVLFTALGIYSTNKMEPVWGKDPSRIVVDEMVGVWIPLLAVPEGSMGYYVLASFVLFRVFDIFKPLGIRKMEDLKGGLGVMMDDILAGIYSLVLIILARWVIG